MLAIEIPLDTGPPRVCTPELYQQKCAAVFEHVYESYPERDADVSATAGRMVRPDLTGFGNGLPLVVIELEKPGVPARAALYEKGDPIRSVQSVQPGR